MSKIAIITDSSAYLPPDLVKKQGIEVMPLTIIWGKETLLDDVDITPDEFLVRLARDPVHPSTTQPNPEDFLAIYQRLAPKVDGIVNVLISSALSGTVNSAEAASNDFHAVPVRTVDSRLTTMGLGFAVLAASRAAQDGKSIDQVVEIATEEAAKSRVFFVVNTLDYLHKGGRIGGASKFLGSALNLKPLLHLNGGIVDSLEKVRTKSKAVERMLEVGAEYAAGRRVRASVIHTGVPDEASLLAEEVAERFDCVEQFITGISPAISVHVGPGALGLCICPM
jgi:DegV family protein with EDD domain